MFQGTMRVAVGLKEQGVEWNSKKSRGVCDLLK